MTDLVVEFQGVGKRYPHFTLDDIMTAYDTFGNAGREHALKVVMTNK